MSEKSTRRDVLKWTGAGAAALAASGLPEPVLAKPPFFKLYLMIFNNLQLRMIWTDLIGKQFARLGIDVNSSYQPPSVVIARRANDSGKTHVEGGFDMYSERIYYNGLAPTPEAPVPAPLSRRWIARKPMKIAEMLIRMTWTSDASASALPCPNRCS